jgi:hypothetical protein
MIRVEVEQWDDGAWSVAVVEGNSVIATVSGLHDRNAALANVLLIASERYERRVKREKA